MKLSVVIGTYNRLNLLQKCIKSIFDEISKKVKVYVTDAGSTDGSIEYLQSIASDRIFPIFVGKKIGQAKAYNDVFALVDTPYVCWLSDDNVVVNRGLDTALEILEENTAIGMVALKAKDKQGPFIEAPYIGGLSSIGILNVNQGMLPTTVLKKVGGFSEEFIDYGIDPDLTAKVLFAGYKIVYTKKIVLHHYRNWSMDTDSHEYQQVKKKHERYFSLYDQKYSKCLNNRNVSKSSQAIERAIRKLKKNRIISRNLKNKSIIRDLNNTLNGHYINILDLLLTIGKKYYLVQSPPKSTTV